MGGKLVSSPPPDKSEIKTQKFKTHTETFEKLCPEYIAIGMTYEQFWDGDPKIAKFYRQAQEIKERKVNTHMWLLGAYVYEAICDVSPILNIGAKKGSKPIPWRERPFAITEKDRKEEERQKEIKSYQNCKAYFARMANVKGGK